MAARLETFDFLYFGQPLVAIFLTIPITIFCFSRLGFYTAVIRFISLNFLNLVIKGSIISSATLFIVAQLLELSVPRSVPFIYLFFISCITWGHAATG